MYEYLDSIWSSISYFFCSVVKYFSAERQKEKPEIIELDPRHIIHEDDIIRDDAGRLTKIIYYYDGRRKIKHN